MAHRVTVAEAGDPNLPPERRLGTIPDLDREWEEQPKVTLDVEDDELLGDLLTRAGAELDRIGPFGSQPEPYTPTYICLYRDGERPQLWHDLTFLDAEGQVRWTYKWWEETYGEFLRAVEAGLIRGDPSRLYYIRMGGMGNGFVSHFPVFIESLPIYWQVCEYAATALGLAKGIEWLAEKAEAIRKAKEVTEDRAERWGANGAMPYKIVELVRRKHGWDAAELGGFLGVTPEDAEALLTSFGCAKESDGQWRPGTDEVSKLMGDNMQFLIQSGQIEREAVGRFLRERIETYARTGQAPDLDWEAVRDLPLDPQWTAYQSEPPPPAKRGRFRKRLRPRRRRRHRR